MRISIPNIPLPSAKNPAFVNPLADISHSDAVARVKGFLDRGKGKTVVLTGAGVSVDSGIRAYRGTEGHCEFGDVVVISLMQGGLTSCTCVDTQNPNFRFVGQSVAGGERQCLFPGMISYQADLLWRADGQRPQGRSVSVSPETRNAGLEQLIEPWLALLQ